MNHHVVEYRRSEMARLTDAMKAAQVAEKIELNGKERTIGVWNTASTPVEDANERLGAAVGLFWKEVERAEEWNKRGEVTVIDRLLLNKAKGLQTHAAFAQAAATAARRARLA